MWQYQTSDIIIIIQGGNNFVFVQFWIIMRPTNFYNDKRNNCQWKNQNENCNITDFLENFTI